MGQPPRPCGSIQPSAQATRRKMKSATDKAIRIVSARTARLEVELGRAMKPSASAKLTRIARSAMRMTSRTAKLSGLAAKAAPAV